MTGKLDTEIAIADALEQDDACSVYLRHPGVEAGCAARRLCRHARIDPHQ